MSNTPNYQLVDINELEAKLTEIAIALREIKDVNDNEKWSWQDNYVEKVKNILTDAGDSTLKKVTINYNLDRAGLDLDEEGTIIGFSSNGYKKINMLEFANSEKIQTLLGADKVVIIETGAFMDCKELKEIELPALMFWDGFAFKGCKKLEKFSAKTLTNNYDEMEYIPFRLFGNGFEFEGCSSLTDVELPSLQRGSEGMFRGCSSLTNIELPLLEQFDGDYMFADCSNLKTFNFPMLEGIGNKGMFQNCTSLEEVHYSQFKTFGAANNNVFEGCINLKKVVVDRGFVVSSQSFKNCEKLVGFETPEDVSGGVYYLGDEAFYNCKNLQFLNTEENEISTIGTRTFFGCEALTNLKSTSNNIGEEGLMGCTSLTDFSLSYTYSNALNIGNKAFYGCSSLKNINIEPGGAEAATIGEEAFEGCDNVERLVITTMDITTSYFYNHHDNINYLKVGGDTIPANCFEDWNLLTYIGLPNTNYIEENAFKDCSNVEIIYAPSATIRSANLFEGCNKLKNLNLGSLKRVTGMPFPNLSSLPIDEFYWGGADPITIENGQQLTNAKKIYLNSTTELQDNVFENFTNLKNFSGTYITTIGKRAFAGCIGLTSLKFANTTTIGDEAFADCINLAELDIPKVTSLGEGFIKNCPLLTTLSAGITRITSNFLTGSNISTLSLTGQVSLVGESALANNDKIQKIYLGVYDNTVIESKAFANCTNLTSLYFTSSAEIELPDDFLEGTPIAEKNGTIYLKSSTSKSGTVSSSLAYYTAKYPQYNFVEY